MIDYDKLKHEWKTFSLALVTVSVGTWDAAVAAGYDLSPIIPDHYRPYVVPAVGLGFIVLRQYRNVNTQ